MMIIKIMDDTCDDDKEMMMLSTSSLPSCHTDLQKHKWLYCVVYCASMSNFNLNQEI